MLLRQEAARIVAGSYLPQSSNATSDRLSVIDSDWPEQSSCLYTCGSSWQVDAPLLRPLLLMALAAPLARRIGRTSTGRVESPPLGRHSTSGLIHIALQLSRLTAAPPCSTILTSMKRFDGECLTNGWVIHHPINNTPTQKENTYGNIARS